MIEVHFGEDQVYPDSTYEEELANYDGPYVDLFNTNDNLFISIGPFNYDNDSFATSDSFYDINDLYFKNGILFIGFEYHAITSTTYTSVGRSIDEIYTNCEAKHWSMLYPGGLMKINIESLVEEYYFVIGECISVNSINKDNSNNLWVGTGSKSNSIFIIDVEDTIYNLH